MLRRQPETGPSSLLRLNQPLSPHTPNQTPAMLGALRPSESLKAALDGFISGSFEDQSSDIELNDEDWFSDTSSEGSGFDVEAFNFEATLPRDTVGDCIIGGTEQCPGALRIDQCYPLDGCRAKFLEHNVCEVSELYLSTNLRPRPKSSS